MIRKLILNMCYSILLVILFLSATSCSHNHKNKATGKIEGKPIMQFEKGKDWQPLFDGKTFNGWRGIGRDNIPKGRWVVEGGAIRNIGSGEVESIADGQPSEGGDIMTTGKFENFELYFEWKISKAGNSGVKYNVSEEMSLMVEPKYSALGFEFQLLDDNDEKYEGVDPTHLSGALYDMVKPMDSNRKHFGVYNTSRIKVQGNLVEHWLNGVKVVAFEFGSVRLDSLCQNSKYRNYKGFLDKREGHIVLQNHKDDAWFRNVKIKKL